MITVTPKLTIRKSRDRFRRLPWVVTRGGRVIVSVDTWQHAIDFVVNYTKLIVERPEFADMMNMQAKEWPQR